MSRWNALPNGQPNLNLGILIMISNLRTTLNRFGIGTSFSKDQDYFISTTESPYSPNLYETIIKVVGVNVIPIVVLLSSNPKDATLNHIAMTRMAISLNKNDWNEIATEDFIPHIIAKELDKSMPSEPYNLKSGYIESLLEMAGLPISDKPSLMHQSFYILGIIFGTILGYRIGIHLGVISAIIFVIIGGILGSSIVAFIAVKVFGYRP